MKRFLKVLFVFSLAAGLAAGCAKEYDDTELKGKVESLSAEVNTLKANQQAMQAVIDVWKKGGYIANIDNDVPGQHTITFYGTEGKTVIIYDGVDGEDGEDGKDGVGGDSFFKSVVTTEDGVTFTLKDDTSFTIPFAKAFKLVIENQSAEIEAGTPVEFPYQVQNANATTTVEVFANNNYEAVVNETDKKIVVTPPTPAVNGSVLVWAQNEEGLMSMRKLNFTVKADVKIDAEVVEDLKAIPADAGDVEVSIVSNIPVNAVAPNVDWLTVALSTKTNYKLVLTLTENTTGEPRETSVKIVRADNGSQVQEIKIVQTATKAEPTPFDSNVTWTLGEKAYENKVTEGYLGHLNVTYDGVEYKDVKHVKLGTSSKVGNFTVKVPKGTAAVSFWAVCWNDKDTKIKIEALGKEFNLVKREGVKGTSDASQPYDMTPVVTDDDQFVVALPAPLEADTEVKIETVANPGVRAVFFGIVASETVPTPKMKMSDIQALCTSSSNAEFVGEFKGLYINYILGSNHIYLEDESGAIRFYSEKGKTVKVGGEDYTLKVGDKISGVLSGMCRLDSGRPTINYLDFTNATVEAAPAEEQPKPVTGTIGSFTNVAGLMYRRVTLEDVVLGANIVSGKGSQIVTISDATGSIPLHLRFDPEQTIPQGYKVSGTGTFDVNGGKLEIRIFAKTEVTKVTAPE